MISTNALSLFLLKNNQNGICKRNLRLIQELMHLYKPSIAKFKWVCADFPNLALLIKSATTGGVQVTYVHTPVGKKSLGKL